MRKLTLLILVFAFMGCSGPEAGVSFKLAQERRETICELGYRLFFNLPEDPKAPIQASQTIGFQLERSRQIILDFKEDPATVALVQVNGRQAKYRFKNEHIVIPRRYFKKDTNTITIDFRAGEQSLNRNDDFLYTLLVPDRARTLFPCFDQPNLKATYTLTLELPTHWKPSPIRLLKKICCRVMPYRLLKVPMQKTPQLELDVKELLSVLQSP